MERTIRNSRLRRAFKSYEYQVQKLLGEYKTYTDEQRLFKPENGGWSIAQVFFHLEQIQDMARTAMQNRIASGKAKPAGLKHTWRYIVLVSALILPIKYNAPRALVELQKKSLPADHYPKSWIASLKELEEFLIAFPVNQQKNLLFMHPAAGPLPVHHSLGFMIAHLRHHKRQLGRIKASVGFPK